MNPVGLTITAIAGAAYLLYRYWGTDFRFLVAGKSGSVSKPPFDGGVAGATRLILDWSLAVFTVPSPA